MNWDFRRTRAIHAENGNSVQCHRDADDAVLLADAVSAAQISADGVKAGQIFWYRAQLVDRTGNESGYTDWGGGRPVLMCLTSLMPFLSRSRTPNCSKTD
jgi:predicted phage tail protein